ncbi:MULTISPECIES: VOC family protein [Curvibacter]|uniref:VOC family protein n=1 Tax=Curvibacter TaxID=281915 RepID=UPI000481A962|nr:MULTISPECIES: VOC family protein [Curvibacter]MBV5291455.1 VOC family protein [Curvibacter lanceolatus]
MKVTRPTPAHFGIYVYDVDRMVDFYTRVFRLTITDEGIGKNFGNRLVFMSATEDQHHQFVLSGGRSAESPVSTIMQASFIVPDLAELRWNREQAQALGATQIQPMNHGNAWSVYYFDPEGNRVEVYMDTPYYVNQPYGVPLDLNKTEEALLSETHAMVRDDPSFMPLAEWQERFRQKGVGARG